MVGSDHGMDDEWARQFAASAARDRRKQFWLILLMSGIGGMLFFWVSGALGADLSVPDLTITPGVVAITDMETVCNTSWGKDKRHVTAAMKRQVFAAYGLKGNTDKACTRDKHGRRCEIDHLISRELGGADEVDNLWPQPYGSKPWNAVMKDRVENRLHRDVCSGVISLAHAQNEIRLDWRIPYRRYFGEPR